MVIVSRSDRFAACGDSKGGDRVTRGGGWDGDRQRWVGMVVSGGCLMRSGVRPVLHQLEGLLARGARCDPRRLSDVRPAPSSSSLSHLVMGPQAREPRRGWGGRLRPPIVPYIRDDRSGTY